MTEERIEGTARQAGGSLQQGLGRLLGDREMQVRGGLEKVKGKTLDVYGRAVTQLEGPIDRAPEKVQPYARKAVTFARERPWATMAGLAALTFLLARGGRHRRR
jgi:uncharacterized protein YjbJ (UPF0337 family)